MTASSLPSSFYALTGLESTPWWQALESLITALETEDAELEPIYISLFRSLCEAPSADLIDACARTLLWREHALSVRLGEGEPSETLRRAALLDLKRLLPLLNKDWQAEVELRLGKSVAALEGLIETQSDKALVSLKTALEGSSPKQVLDILLDIYTQQGAGILARYAAFRYMSGGFVGIEQPAEDSLGRLIALNDQIKRLTHNTERFLQGLGAHHTLLYGPRGTGKSTAVRGLLTRYAAQSLRLVELSSSELSALPDLTAKLRNRPQHYIIFVDDLSFEAGDDAYHPLKTVLEGSLSAPTKNVLVYATSNRRHLITEKFSDRPDPLNEDVHAWDTQNERLALADRFGLTITFPNASQQRYLRIVEGLLQDEGLEPENWRERAVRHADWGNGYSGRTARQFVDGL